MTAEEPITPQFLKGLGIAARIALWLAALCVGPMGLFGVWWTEGKQWQSYGLVALAIAAAWLGVRGLPLRRTKPVQQTPGKGANP
jgi:predicted glycosyl hydrolase (DUF1957 family)